MSLWKKRTRDGVGLRQGLGLGLGRCAPSAAAAAASSAACDSRQPSSVERTIIARYSVCFENGIDTCDVTCILQAPLCIRFHTFCQVKGCEDTMKAEQMLR